MSIQSNRPRGFSGEGDRHLPPVVKRVTRFLKDRRKQFFGNPATAIAARQAK